MSAGLHNSTEGGKGMHCQKIKIFEQILEDGRDKSGSHQGEGVLVRRKVKIKEQVCA